MPLNALEPTPVTHANHTPNPNLECPRPTTHATGHDRLTHIQGGKDLRSDLRGLCVVACGLGATSLHNTADVYVVACGLGSTSLHNCVLSIPSFRLTPLSCMCVLRGARWRSRCHVKHLSHPLNLATMGAYPNPNLNPNPNSPLARLPWAHILRPSE